MVSSPAFREAFSRRASSFRHIQCAIDLPSHLCNRVSVLPSRWQRMGLMNRGRVWRRPTGAEGRRMLRASPRLPNWYHIKYAQVMFYPTNHDSLTAPPILRNGNIGKASQRTHTYQFLQARSLISHQFPRCIIPCSMSFTISRGLSILSVLRLHPISRSSTPRLILSATLAPRL